MRGAVAHAGGLPRVTVQMAEQRARHLVLDFDPATPGWVRAVVDAHREDLVFALAKKLLAGFALWECAALSVAPGHPLSDQVSDVAVVMEREDLADRFEADRETSRKILEAPDERELRVVVVPLGDRPWIGALWITEAGAR